MRKFFTKKYSDTQRGRSIISKKNLTLINGKVSLFFETRYLGLKSHLPQEGTAIVVMSKGVEGFQFYPPGVPTGGRAGS